ncbi:b(o/a)3-type cytochrome-c oxidase subunit 1 [Anaerolineales bacterium HSG6]|nr:b(o/a)3-type cytochrome-c oxidase subunit 1 [Anaerolineales bacterium HSG6]MDM8532312.1 b(o/a)3-type cytochrome-c oxidase subunit 1 [Anaerolineales bacterium HSG25]
MNLRNTLSFERKYTGAHIGIAMFALFLGTLYGPLQALEHAGINLYFLAPWTKSYYHGLTLHGVLNALIFTTFFISGFLTYVVSYSLKRPIAFRWVANLGLILMVVGFVTAAIPLLLNMATVLYTFYPPMKAHSAFYIGVTVLVVGSWVVGLSIFLTLAAWYKDNPGERAPLAAFMSAITFAMWQICTIGAAVELLALLIPWSLGFIDGIDPQFARTLFWYTGHPLVYFWLLPAYMSWYVMVPKLAGGKLFSDPMARLSFLLFLIFSTPTGFHHQFTDPGIAAGWKLIHSVLTFSVFFPSLLTMFNMWASLNIAGKMRDGTGYVAWIAKLPWGKPELTAQLLAAILFLFGGIGGIINASYNINLVIHNTAWVSGHFHTTVGSAVALTFIGTLYWLLPHLTGKGLFSKKAALAQVWTWFVGMIIFSRGMHLLGLLGAPRRTQMGVAIKSEIFFNPDWNVPMIWVGVGGTILLISYILIYVNVVGTLVAGRKLSDEEIPDVPLADAVSRPEQGPMILSRWKPWLATATGLIILSYGPMIIQSIYNYQATSPGFQPW